MVTIAARPAALRHPDRPAGDAAPPARVGFLSGTWQPAGEWMRRGLTPYRLPAGAIERLFADPPDVIVVDAARDDARPVADCWQLADLLGVPLVVLAPGAAAETVTALLARGATDVITESRAALPVALLAARVAAVVRRTGRREGARLPVRLQVDGGEIDLVHRVVRRADGARSLSATEFRLLLALLRAGGRTCPHGELMARVWGPSSTSATHYLRLYVQYLREKIEADPRRPRHLVNVRGSGYRLVLDGPASGAPSDGVGPDAGIVPIHLGRGRPAAKWELVS
jgi:two-component system KDP operon response regulator KdpE